MTTDAEREAQIEGALKDLRPDSEIIYLWNKLTEARAEISERTANQAGLQRAWGEERKKVARLEAEIEQLKADRERIGEFLDGISEPMPPLGDSHRIARLTAPPGASAIPVRRLSLAIMDYCAGTHPQDWSVSHIGSMVGDFMAARSLERDRTIEQAEADIPRLRHAVTVAYGWFAAHEYSGDGLNVCQILREASSPEEVAKAKAAEARVLTDTIAANRREAEAGGRAPAIAPLKECFDAYETGDEDDCVVACARAAKAYRAFAAKPQGE